MCTRLLCVRSGVGAHLCVCRDRDKKNKDTVTDGEGEVLRGRDGEEKRETMVQINEGSHRH